MFNQIHRKIEIIDGCVKRSYLDIDDIRKALNLKRTLLGLSFVPSVVCFDIHKRLIVEEFIIGKKLKLSRFKEEQTVLMARILKQLHVVKLSKRTKNLFSDEFVKGGIYHPKTIFESGLKFIPNGQSRYKKRYGKLVNKLEKFFLRNSADLALIHGDIRPENIISDKDKISLIDWEDARIDLPLVDVYGFFENFGLNRHLRDVFWKEYGKPEYWSGDLEKYFEIVCKIFDKAPEYITLIVPTYNRSPFRSVYLNPLYTTIKSMLEGKGRLIKCVIISDDCSSDFTYQTYLFLRKRFQSIEFVYNKNTQRIKASANRQRAIKLCKSELFLMTDDDCLFPSCFVKEAYSLFRKIRMTDRNIAILNLPYVNKGFDFEGLVSVAKYGKFDQKNHWFYNNFNLFPEKVRGNYLPIDIFEGIFIGLKSRILEVGGFEDLRDFTVDYAEYVLVAKRLKESGYTIYRGFEKNILVTHLKFGEVIESLKLRDIPIEYRAILARSNRSVLGSGDRVHKLRTVESLVSSFVYFYFCISEYEGVKHIKKELEYLGRFNGISNETIDAYKKGVMTALRIAKKKGVIAEIDSYISIMDKMVAKYI